MSCEGGAAGMRPEEPDNKPSSPNARIAVSVRNLGKRYRIYNSVGDRLKELLLLKRKKLHWDFWALRNVDLDVEKGRTVGIVGRNGSGKSTLLQIICGTVAPNEGTVETYGRIAGLLELGSGFHMEFTGRENVYVNAAILGLSREETRRKFQAIEEFADIGPFIDQPVRSYSSGMYVRLAFSVAINVEPEILVVDEAMAVGDEMFQRKCFQRIRDLKEQGATILFVSHSAGIVTELCDTVALLDRGELILTGSAKDVFARYRQLVAAPANHYEEVRRRIVSLNTKCTGQDEEERIACAEQAVFLQNGEADDSPNLEPYFDPELVSEQPVSYVPHGARILNPRLTTDDGRRVNVLVGRHSYVYSYDVVFETEAGSVRLAMLINTNSGYALGGSFHSSVTNPISRVRKGMKLTASFRFTCNLLPGPYSINSGILGVVGGVEHHLHRVIYAMSFRVLSHHTGHAYGPVDFLVEPAIFLEASSGTTYSLEG
ncbi:MAG: ABC transporter ATP-binding protein [Desulfomonilaceae bacterium]|nr:ABC transporter ATP-binding protein [Desulfomonilaceae bacterium]